MIAALLALALQAVAPQPSDAPQFRGEGQMRIFDLLCNRAFPDDARIDAAMAKSAGARPLTPAEVRTYLNNDPGHGWILPAGTSQIVITLESPPIHACAIRMTNTDGVIDEQVWQRLIAAAQARAGGGFTTVPLQTLNLAGDMQTRATGVQKQGPDGAAEAIYLIRTGRKAAFAEGTGIEIRMVRQLIAAPAR